MAINPRTASLLLVIRAEGWSAYRSGATGEPLAAGDELPLIMAGLREAGCRRAPLVVALESGLCASARFEASSLRQARRRESLGFLAEELLPMAAEELASDYVVDGLKVLALTTELERLRSLLEALAGLDVRCVAPLAILAASERARQRGAGVWFWNRPHAIEQIVWGASGPSDWRTHPKDFEAVRGSLALQRLATGHEEVRATWVGAPWEPLMGSAALGEGIVLEGENSLVEGSDACLYDAALAAERLAKGQHFPVVDFRRDASLHHSGRYHPLRIQKTVALAAALLMAFAALGWQASANHAEAKLRELEAQEAQLFREALPGQAVPRGVRPRLESELRRLAGARPGDASIPERRDAALRLQAVLDVLPGDLRFRLDELQIEGPRVGLLGEARSHADADQVAAALRKAGLAVAPPSTRQLATEGVEFRLTAHEPAAESGDKP